MTRLDSALDEYIHLITRVRPWTRRVEEVELLAFCEWVYAQPDVPFRPEVVEPAHASRYASSVGLSAERTAALRGAVDNFHHWAEHNGLTPAAPPAGAKQESL